MLNNDKNYKNVLYIKIQLSKMNQTRTTRFHFEKAEVLNYVEK